MSICLFLSLSLFLSHTQVAVHIHQCVFDNMGRHATSAVVITFVFLTSMKASLKLILLETRKHELAALTVLSFWLSIKGRGASCLKQRALNYSVSSPLSRNSWLWPGRLWTSMALMAKIYAISSHWRSKEATWIAIYWNKRNSTPMSCDCFHNNGMFLNCSDWHSYWMLI